MADGAVNIPNATPFDLIQEDANDFLLEARNWADGSAVETRAQADEVARLIDHARKLAKAAEDARKDENKPHDEAKAAVQAKYAPLFADPKTKTPGAVFKAMEALKSTLAPYLRKVDAEKREAARLAQEAADKAARDAAEAMRAANPADMGARDEAEAAVQAAEDARKAASAASRDKAHAIGGERAIGLRTVHTGVILNLTDAARHYWQQDETPFRELVQHLVDADVRAGRRGSMIPGVEVCEEQVV